MPTMTAQQRRDEARVEFDAYLASCPSRKLLDRISDKWVTLVLKSLADGPKRYSEVSHQLAGVSQNEINIEKTSLASSNTSIMGSAQIEQYMPQTGGRSDIGPTTT